MIGHFTTPITCAAMGSEVRFARYHGEDEELSHVEHNCTSHLIGAASGTGKTQGQRAILRQFSKFEEAFGIDVVTRDITTEALVSKMEANGGSAVLMVDEGMGFFKSENQYKSGGNDREIKLSMQVIGER